MHVSLVRKFYIKLIFSYISGPPSMHLERFHYFQSIALFFVFLVISGNFLLEHGKVLLLL